MCIWLLKDLEDIWILFSTVMNLILYFICKERGRGEKGTEIKLPLEKKLSKQFSDFLWGGGIIHTYVIDLFNNFFYVILNVFAQVVDSVASYHLATYQRI